MWEKYVAQVLLPVFIEILKVEFNAQIICESAIDLAELFV